MINKPQNHHQPVERKLEDLPPSAPGGASQRSPSLPGLRERLQGISAQAPAADDRVRALHAHHIELGRLAGGQEGSGINDADAEAMSLQLIIGDQAAYTDEAIPQVLARFAQLANRIGNDGERAPQALQSLAWLAREYAINLGLQRSASSESLASASHAFLAAAAQMAGAQGSTEDPLRTLMDGFAQGLAIKHVKGSGTASYDTTRPAEERAVLQALILSFSKGNASQLLQEVLASRLGADGTPARNDPPAPPSTTTSPNSTAGSPPRSAQQTRPFAAVVANMAEAPFHDAIETIHDAAVDAHASVIPTIAQSIASTAGRWSTEDFVKVCGCLAAKFGARQVESQLPKALLAHTLMADGQDVHGRRAAGFALSLMAARRGLTQDVVEAYADALLTQPKDATFPQRLRNQLVELGQALGADSRLGRAATAYLALHISHHLRGLAEANEIENRALEFFASGARIKARGAEQARIEGDARQANRAIRAQEETREKLREMDSQEARSFLRKTADSFWTRWSGNGDLHSGVYTYIHLSTLAGAAPLTAARRRAAAPDQRPIPRAASQGDAQVPADGAAPGDSRRVDNPPVQAPAPVVQKPLNIFEEDEEAHLRDLSATPPPHDPFEHLALPAQAPPLSADEALGPLQQPSGKAQ